MKRYLRLFTRAQPLRGALFTLLALTLTPTLTLHCGHLISSAPITLTLPSLFSSILQFLLEGPGGPALSFLFERKLLVLSLSWCALVALAAYRATRPLPVYLLEYACFKPDNDRKLSYETCEYFVRRSRRFNTVSEEFMRTIFLKSGLGNETYAPPFIFQTDYEAKLKSAFQEAEEGLFSSVDALFTKTKVDPSQVDILIVACGMFIPCPSLSSIIVSHYGFRPTIKTFNLSGMGCSAGSVSIDMAAKMLRRKPGYALVVVTESTSLNWYFGDNRHMLVTNCIFRVGTAAVLVTSDQEKRGAAKLELLRSLRTHHGADDASYGAGIQQEDAEGNVGVALNKDLVRVAGAGLRDHITTLAPRVLPLSELLYYAYAVVRSMLLRRPGGQVGKQTQAHSPDFTKAFEHMCFHPGGKAVINALGRLLNLTEAVLEPTRMTLHRFGNTSSSSIFYELAYFDAKGRIRRGDRLWMLAFGTGFKACSLVWRALRDSCPDQDNPWSDCIHVYPV
ncbi:hypothetical protein Taro_006404 [Colocasia esculenta]|uniref:3-ketoacyl-CoA synthase n=1 Tax=Colocasia esculenta TaxID=4460 RepID=A0A843TV79_COLES|nr:hypothetical protein [Colocasia esculenta]